VSKTRGSFFEKAASKRSAQEEQEKLEAAIRAGARRDYGTAVSILEELISRYEPPPDAYLLLGRSLHALKNYSKALAAFNDYLRIYPRSAQGYLFAGRTYLALGLPHRAVPVLRRALRFNPSDAFTMALLGAAYLKSNHSQPAVDILEEAVETAAGNRPSAAGKSLSQREQRRIYRAYLNALLIRGIRLCRDGNFSLGVPMLRFVLENGLDLPLLRLELGRACREMGELDEAVEHYSQALKYAPHDPRIRWYRASLLMTLGRNTEALREIALIRSAGGDVPDLPWNSRLVDWYMIRSFLELGEWRRAAEACRNWFKYRDQDPMVHAMFAEAQRNTRDYTSAMNHLDRAVKLEPNRLELWYEMILVAWEGKDWKKLRRALKNAGKLGGDPDIIKRFSLLREAAVGEDDTRIVGLLQEGIRSLGPEPELMYALGERYLKLGLIEASIPWFKKTRSLLADHERAYLGEIAAHEALFNEGEDAAREPLKAAYEAYLDRWPDNHGIRREWALFLIRICEFAEASKELETLLAWEPANPALRRVLAYTYRKTGRYREAAVFLKALLREKPQDIPLLLEFSGCLERAGGVYYARVLLEKALEVFKRSPEIPIALGVLLFREQKIERAFDLLREAAARNTADPRPYRWMALIARKTGDIDGAKRFEKEELERKKAAVPLK
jgi:tetratricopeptide (TPR) repeat protein